MAQTSGASAPSLSTFPAPAGPRPFRRRCGGRGSARVGPRTTRTVATLFPKRRGGQLVCLTAGFTPESLRQTVRVVRVVRGPTFTDSPLRQPRKNASLPAFAGQERALPRQRQVVGVDQGAGGVAEHRLDGVGLEADDAGGVGGVVARE